MSAEKLEQLGKNIRRCDTSRPYLFVSYSSADAEYVFEDVIELQNRGANVWIDDRWIDKTRSSWKDSALPAIRDIDCRLVIFYVSKNSLMSAACLDELRETWKEETKELHGMQPVGFICVDVRTRGSKAVTTETSVLDLIDECWSENARNYDEEIKKIRSERMRAASCFYKEIFNGTNERVRIAARKGEPARSGNYYRDMWIYFPDPVILTKGLPLDKLIELADGGDPVSQHSLGLYYYHMATETKHEKRAGETEAGSVMTDKEKEDYKKKSFDYYSRSAKQGFPKAENKMGLCYRRGNYPEKDLKEKEAWEKAFEWFRKAADQGDDMGQFNLGECFEFGIGTEKNLDAAILWYKMAAAKGNSRSKYKLQKLEREESADEV